MTAGGSSGLGGGQQLPQSQTDYTQQTQSSSPLAIQGGQSGQADGSNMLLAVFMAMLGSINVVQSLAKTSSDVVEFNAKLQESENKKIMSFKFEVLPSMTGWSSTDRTDEINRVNQFNQNVQFQRQNVQSIVITLRQSGKSEMVEAQVNVNYLQQNSSELTAVLKMMVVIMQLINKIANPSG